MKQVRYKVISFMDRVSSHLVFGRERDSGPEPLLQAMDYFYRALEQIKQGNLNQHDAYQALLNKFFQDINFIFNLQSKNMALTGIMVKTSDPQVVISGVNSNFWVLYKIEEDGKKFTVKLYFESEQARQNFLENKSKPPIDGAVPLILTTLDSFYSFVPHYFELIDHYIRNVFSGYTDAMTGAVNRKGFEHDLNVVINHTDRDMFLIGIDFPTLLASLNYYGHDIGDKGLKEFFNIMTGRSDEVSYRDVPQASSRYALKDEHGYRDVVSVFIRLWPHHSDRWEDEAQGFIHSRFEKWQAKPFVIPEVKQIENMPNVQTRDNLLQYINQPDILKKMLDDSQGPALPSQLTFGADARFLVGSDTHAREVSLKELSTLMYTQQFSDIHSIKFIKGSVHNLDLNNAKLLYNPKLNLYYSIGDCLKKAIPIRIQNPKNHDEPVSAANILAEVRTILKQTSIGISSQRVLPSVSYLRVDNQTDQQFMPATFRNQVLYPAEIRFLSDSMKFMKSYYEEGASIDKGIDLWLKRMGQQELDHWKSNLGSHLSQYIKSVSFLMTTDKFGQEEVKHLKIPEDQDMVRIDNVSYYRISGRHGHPLGFIKLELLNDYDHLMKQQLQADGLHSDFLNAVFDLQIEELDSNLSHMANLFNLFIHEQHHILEMMRKADFDPLTGLYSEEKIKKIYEQALVDLQSGHSDYTTVLFFDLVGCGAFASISDEAVEGMKRKFADILKQKMEYFNHTNPGKKVSIGVSNGEEFKVVGHNVSKPDLNAFIRSVQNKIRDYLSLPMSVSRDKLEQLYQTAPPGYFAEHILPVIDQFYDQKTDSFYLDVVRDLPKWHAKSGKVVIAPLIDSLSELSRRYPSIPIQDMESRFWGVGGVGIAVNDEPGYINVDAILPEKWSYLTHIPEEISEIDRLRRGNELLTPQPHGYVEFPITWMESPNRNQKAP